MKNISTRIKRSLAIGLSVAALFAAVAGVQVVRTGTAHAAADCDARGIGSDIFTNSTNNSAYTIEGDKATVTFNVTGKDCQLPVTMVVWKAPNGTTGKPFSEQVLFSHVTKTFSEGRHTLTGTLPDCFFQVDTVTGTKLTGSTGGAHDYDNRQVAYMHGGTKSCNAPAPKPSLVCSGLVFAPVGGQKLTYKFTAKATASNTKVTSYTFKFSDGTTKTVTSAAATAELVHTFAKAGTAYTVTVSVTGADNKDVTSTACAVKVTTPKPEECKPGVPLGHPDCEAAPVVEVTPVTPAAPGELPNTGPGAIVASLFAGTSVFGAIGHRLVTRRLHRG